MENYKLTDNKEDLLKLGFEYDDEGDCYALQIISRKIKGMFVPFITLGYILIGWYNVK